MNSRPFENVRNQIGYCGIWCGSCIVGNGILRELTKEYEKFAENYGLKEWVPGEFDFKEFEKGLSFIWSAATCLGCLKGGGRMDCEIRACATAKKLTECTGCEQSSRCKNKTILRKMRTGAKRAELRVKKESISQQKLIAKWLEEMKSEFPYSLGFMRDQPCK